MLLLHNNASVNTDQIAKATVRDYGFETMDDPPYNSDLGPNLKKDHRGNRYADDETLQAAVKEHFDNQNENYFKLIDVITALKGDYIEKK